MAQRQFRSDDTDPWLYGFGDGSDGAYEPTTSTEAPIDSSCSGTSGTTSLSATNASFAAGQLIMIHQTRGTGVGGWELNKIDSYSTGTITLKHDLTMTYTDSGASQAQVRVLKQYSSALIDTGVTLTGKSWNQNVGGIVGWLCSGTTTITGTVRTSGSTGGTKTGAGLSSNTTGGGHYGGYSRTLSGIEAGTASQGFGSAGSGVESTAANGSGGGGGSTPASPANASGGGGGHGAAGSSGSGGGTGGSGGLAVGGASLVSFNLGGGGGGGVKDNNTTSGAGGSGAGSVIIISKDISITGAITSTGGAGGSGTDEADGGGGAGGAVLVKAQTATLGAAKITAAGGTGTGSGGAGAVGRIHLDYKDSYTGTTSPTLDVTQDLTLDYISTGVEDTQGYFLA